MKRVLLDENLDWRIKRWLDPSFEVTTVREQNLTGFKNGALLRVTEKHFDVFVTLDRKIEYQQNISGLDIAIILIRSPIAAARKSNRS